MTDEYNTEWVVVPMPLNAAGQGPETDPALVARTEWHVWTRDCIAVAVAQSEAVAEHIVDVHNREVSQ